MSSIKSSLTPSRKQNDIRENNHRNHYTSRFRRSNDNPSNHGILSLNYANNKTGANLPLKYCQSDIIIKGETGGMSESWDFNDLAITGDTTLPIGEPPSSGGSASSVTGMTESSNPKSAFPTSISTKLIILIGKNNMGWNVSILDHHFGMGDQGSVKFPVIANGVVGGSGSTKDVKGGEAHLKHSQVVNIRNGSKSGFTMLGWYKSWTHAWPKLVDPCNIISDVYYYDGANNQYIAIPENTGNAGDWDGPSSENGNGNRAKTWNIATNLGSTPGIWVKVKKLLTDFESSGGMHENNGTENATSLPKTPFVFLTYD